MTRKLVEYSDSESDDSDVRSMEDGFPCDHKPRFEGENKETEFIPPIHDILNKFSKVPIRINGAHRRRPEDGSRGSKIETFFFYFPVFLSGEDADTIDGYIELVREKVEAAGGKVRNLAINDLTRGREPLHISICYNMRATSEEADRITTEMKRDKVLQSVSFPIPLEFQGVTIVDNRITSRQFVIMELSETSKSTLRPFVDCLNHLSSFLTPSSNYDPDRLHVSIAEIHHLDTSTTTLNLPPFTALTSLSLCANPLVSTRGRSIKPLFTHQ